VWTENSAVENSPQQSPRKSQKTLQPRVSLTESSDPGSSSPTRTMA
jgi:hypothetical protein